MNISTGSWKIGKIIELLPNSEGKVRVAKVLLATKSTVNRPLNLLYPIECESIVDDTTEKKPTAKQQQRPVTRKNRQIN